MKDDSSDRPSERMNRSEADGGREIRWSMMSDESSEDGLEDRRILEI